MQQLAALLMTLVLIGTAFGEGPAASAEELVGFVPSGYYRKLSGNNVMCPEGRFQWIENNKTLAIGGAQPVLFHTFNSKKSLTVPLKTKCVSETANTVKDSTKGKIPSRTVAQVMTNKCGAQSSKSSYTLVATKIKSKTVVNLEMQVTHDGSKSAKVSTHRCSYEIGPIR